MNILLVCACGSSTSVVLQKMKENLTEDEPWTICLLYTSPLFSNEYCFRGVVNCQDSPSET